MKVGKSLKKELWRLFGSREYPAESDGAVYGGGKLSQRFWEYFQALRYLDLDPDAVVLDIGGGSPVTGYGFFSHVLRRHVRQVLICDPNAGEAKERYDNISFIRENADYDTLSRVFAKHPVTHVASLSVFEHVMPEVRSGMIRAVEEHFTGDVFVATYEYHPVKVHFEQQLTTRTASEMFSHFKRFYLTEYSASPTLCENAFTEKGRWGHKAHIPNWYPVAVKFVRG